MMDTKASSQTPQQYSRTFASDPLHSAAYLNGVKMYLAMPEPSRSTIPNRSAPASLRFVYRYKLSNTEIATTKAKLPDAYDSPEKLSSAIRINTETSELVFLSGYPSRQWLKEISDHYNLDFRFLQNHLDFCLELGETGSLDPTFRQGTDTVDISVQELHEARSSCQVQLKQKAKSFFGDSTIQPGQSIIRRINIHSGDMMVIEQALSISINETTSGFRVIVWSDAGDPEDMITTPNTPRFQRLSPTADFCPVFFDQEAQLINATDFATLNASANGNVISRTRQPLAVLPSRYGETMDWNKASSDSLLLLEELFHFHASAASQYLHMLRDLTTERLAQTPPTGDTPPSMDDILHFEYTQTVLIRWCAHFKTVVGALEDDVFCIGAKPLENEGRRRKAKLCLRKDLSFLISEAESLIKICEGAAKDSTLVTQLTKATNRITFIFLPISFVTSVFGMNFRQFGQGPLSITIWLAVTLPLLGICVFLTERKAWLAFWEEFFTSHSKSGGLKTATPR